MGKKQRFPRVRSGQDVKMVEGVLHQTYNMLSKKRSFSALGSWYDIYKVKRGKNARAHFVALADRLLEEKIDPSLYLKVMANYGRFRDTRHLPPTSWLAGTKALDVFRWLVKKERRKHPREVDWRAFLNGAPEIDAGNIRKAIRESWELVAEVGDRWGLGVGTAALAQQDRLSPWFLACCRPYLRLGGLDVLTDKDRHVVEKCMKYLMKRKDVFAQALEQYKKKSVS